MKHDSHEEVNALETKLFLLRESVAGRLKIVVLLGSYTAAGCFVKCIIYLYSQNKYITII
jgi:hypothetical protein